MKSSKRSIERLKYAKVMKPLVKFLNTAFELAIPHPARGFQNVGSKLNSYY